MLSRYLENNTKKHLIFDFDETIFKLHLPWEKYRVILREALQDLAPEVVDKYPTGSTFPIQLEIAEKYGNEGTNVIIDSARKFETEYLEGVSKNEELVSFIKENSNGYDLFIWSTNTLKVINLVLDQHDMTNIFTDIVPRDRVDFIKPNPEGFKYINVPGNRDKAEYLMIGDSSSDEGAAKNVGIDFFHIDADKVDWQLI